MADSSSTSQPRSSDGDLSQLLRKAERVVRSFVPTSDADDIVQQTLLLYLEKRDTVRDAEAWIECVARRQALRHLHKQRRYLRDSVEMALEELRHEPRQERQQLGKEVFEAIARVPERCRSVLQLRYSEGFAPKEIAERLGYQVESVRKVASRCVASLTKQVLGE